MDSVAAHDALAAHSAGAGQVIRRLGRSRAVTGEAVRRLAQHHAEVWLDAVEVVLAELARGRTLPHRIVLCGGAATLPELRRCLTGSAWRMTLPFQLPPAVRLLTSDMLPGVRIAPGAAIPALQFAPSLCIAAMACNEGASWLHREPRTAPRPDGLAIDSRA